MEKRKLTITAIEEKDLGNGKKIFNCQTSSGIKYACWNAKIKDYIGKESDFDVFSKQQGDYTNWYIKLAEEGGFASGGFGKRPFTPSFKDSKDGAILSSKTMTLAYCKDIVVAGLTSAQVKFDPATVWEMVKTGYNALLPLLSLDSIKEPVVLPPAQPHGAEMSEHRHTLKPVLITILKAKMQKMNFRANDMIDFAGALCGIELQKDAANDEIIWTISEEDAHKIITGMG